MPAANSARSAPQIQKDIDANPVVVFMKGIPEQPQCGFSNTVVQIMKAEGEPPPRSTAPAAHTHA